MPAVDGSTDWPTSKTAGKAASSSFCSPEAPRLRTRLLRRKLLPVWYGPTTATTATGLIGWMDEFGVRGGGWVEDGVGRLGGPATSHLQSTDTHTRRRTLRVVQWPAGPPPPRPGCCVPRPRGRGAGWGGRSRRWWARGRRRLVSCARRRRRWRPRRPGAPTPGSGDAWVLCGVGVVMGVVAVVVGKGRKRGNVKWTLRRKEGREGGRNVPAPGRLAVGLFVGVWCVARCGWLCCGWAKGWGCLIVPVCGTKKRACTKGCDVFATHDGPLCFLRAAALLLGCYPWAPPSLPPTARGSQECLGHVQGVGCQGDEVLSPNRFGERQ